MLFLAFLAVAAGSFAFGIFIAVLCLASQHGDALEERERALTHWRSLS